MIVVTKRGDLRTDLLCRRLVRSASIGVPSFKAPRTWLAPPIKESLKKSLRAVCKWGG